MTFYHADDISILIFCFFSAIMFRFAIAYLKKGPDYKIWLSAYLCLILISSAISLTGIAIDYPVPTLPIFISFVFIGAIVYSLSSHALQLSKALPFSVLIGFQCFRLPLEVVLHHWAKIGTIPGTMTWTGSNWDIISGIVALLAIPFVNKIRLVAWSAQLVGFVLLLNVLRVVVLSSPFPFSWPLENPLQLAIYFPYSLIVPLFVFPALVLHLVTFKKLLG